MHTPFDVHFHLAEQLREMRADVLDTVYAKHPERFVRKAPEPPKLPEAAWINKPDQPPTGRSNDPGTGIDRTTCLDHVDRFRTRGSADRAGLVRDGVGGHGLPSTGQWEPM